MDHPKHILQRYRLSPKRSLGQNFLHDDNLLAKICQVAQLTEGDLVLEVGAGLGSLTRHLAKSARQVVALELDDRLIPILRQSLVEHGNVTVVQGDILTWQPGERFKQGYKVVGNVPYYITGAILRRLLSTAPQPESVVVTVQSEVAQRITAVPGDMSMLGVMVQYFGKATLAMKIRAGAFWPVPDVDSSLVHIALRPEERLGSDDEAMFFRLVRAGFQQRRKQLQKNLRGAGYSREAIAAAMNTAGIKPSARAETLSIPQWLALFRALSSA